MASPGSLVVYCCGQRAGEDVVKRLPDSLRGQISLDVSLESEGSVISCIFDGGVISEDQFSYLLGTELDSKGVSHTLALLSPESHVALVSVEGMTCNSCVKLIETTLTSDKGVSLVKVSLESKEAFVQFNPLVTTAEAISTAIYDMGFDTEMKKVYSPVAVDPPRSSITSTVANGSEHVLVQIELPHDSVTINEEKEISYTCLTVEGMSCQSCVNNIQSNISKLDGVQEVTVSLDEKNAKIAYNPILINPNRLASEIDALGFEAKVRGSSPCECPKSPELGMLKTCYVGIDGMRCKSCVNLIESTLGDMEGVVSVQVSLALKEGTIEYNDVLVSVGAITKAIEAIDEKFSVSYVTGKSLTL